MAQEEQIALTIGVGNIELERQTLKPAKVKIVDVKVVDVEKVKSKKVNCEIKHPDKEDTIKISSVAYLLEKQIVTKGLWFNLDKDGKIQKGSALAVFMESLDAKTLEELNGKEVDTDMEGNYLCFKAY